MSTGTKRPNISFDTMFVWFGVEFETVIGQRPKWAESSPPRSLEGTKKPGLLRVKKSLNYLCRKCVGTCGTRCFLPFKKHPLLMSVCIIVLVLQTTVFMMPNLTPDI